MAFFTRPFIWFYNEFGLNSIHATGRNAYLIIAGRCMRMVGNSACSLILPLFFSKLQYADSQIGLFMTLTLLGDVFLGTYLTLVADRWGRRRILLIGSIFMVVSGITLWFFEAYWLLLVAAICGIVSVTGGDFGPFRSIEESILSQLTTPSTRPDVLAWYVTLSTLGSSIGPEASGRVIEFLVNVNGWTLVDAYHTIFLTYVISGIVNIIVVLCLNDACEARSNPDQNYSQLSQEESDGIEATEHRPNVNEPPLQKDPATSRSKFRRWIASLGKSMTLISAPTRSVMYKLWALLVLDSLADGMTPYSLTTYYIDTKFKPSKATLGDVTSVGYFLAAISGIFAGPLSRRIGLINTMVFTHIPSSAAVLFFPFPNVLWMAIVFFFIRTGLNNMDQAPRSAFIAGVVKPSERTAVMGITGTLRTLAATSGPTVTGFLAGSNRFWVAFVAAGAFRLTYDIGLYVLFINVKLNEHEETPQEMSMTRIRRSSIDEETYASSVSSDDVDSEEAQMNLGEQEGRAAKAT